MAEIKFKDQVLSGLGKLIYQWQNKPNVVGLLTSYMESVQGVEDTFEQLLKERSLDTAIGAQLDVLGLIIGEDRKGRSDADYRLALKLRVAINKSDGTEPVVTSLIKQITSADTATFEDVYPAGVKYTLEGLNVEVDDSILDEIKNILAATITAQLLVTKFINPPFVFRNDTSGEGFSDASTNSEFNLITDNGDSIMVSSGEILSVQNPSITLDPETFAGGYLADISIINI